MSRESIEILIVALFGAIITIAANFAVLESSIFLVLAIFLLSFILLPRIIAYYFNWVVIGGPSIYIELHSQASHPHIALTAIWPSFWKKNLCIRGRSYRLNDKSLALRGTWQSDHAHFKNFGSSGKELYYFYSGFETPFTPSAQTVPDGMTSFRINDSGDGTGFFINKVDDASILKKTDLHITKLTKSNLNALCSAEEKIVFSRWGDISDEQFDKFKKQVELSLHDNEKLSELFGITVSAYISGILQKLDHTDITQGHRGKKEENILIKLQNLISNCDARYSGFHVSSCIVTNSGEQYFGVNLENASYPAGICAESSAIAKMVSDIGPSPISEVYVYSPQNDGSLCPCGICLQRISEYATSDTSIIVISDDSTTLREPLKALMGRQFKLST
ncbi:MAG: cytidine deaminase [Methyloligellaceae bacterium]